MAGGAAARSEESRRDRFLGRDEASPGRTAETFIRFHFVSGPCRSKSIGMVRPVPALLSTALFALAGTILPAATPTIRDVDHRYSPATWHAPLGVPDDWHKPMASDRGALLYDFGPGPYALPLTTVEFGLRDQTLTRARQWTESPRVPILRTSLVAGEARIEVTTLSLPPSQPDATNGRFARYERLDGISGALGWAQPNTPCSPEFANVAWGINRPIRYRVRLEPGARKRVVLGFCESYKPRINERVAVMRIEGAAEQVADLALTAARHTPQVFLFEAADADRNGWLDVTVEAAAGKDPNPALALIAVYAAEARFNRDLLLAGATAPADPAELRIACGTEMLQQSPRVDAMHATFPAGAVPVLTVRTGRRLRADARGGLSLGDTPFLVTHPRAEKSEWVKDRWVLHFPVGTSAATALVLSGRATAAGAAALATFDLARAAADTAAHWRRSDIPFGHVTVGDPAIQRLVDASLRTVYQTRERINGQGQFNSSFTLYRGLWTSDVIYMVELAAMLGDFDRARETLDTLLSFQTERGLIEELAPLVMYRAAPAVYWALERYARLSGGWPSVERHWPAIRRGVDALRAARDSTLTTPGAANAGLLPAGFNDGGIADIAAEYSSIYWSITGLRATARAARRLGHADDAARCDRLATEFFEAFQRTSQRDMRTDPHGNRYLPVRVGLTGRDEVPQVAQWGVLEHHLFGEGLPLESELLRGTLAMLEAVESEGLPHSIGWMRDGLWVGFSSLYAHLPLLLGRHDKAADLLYAIANHASPLGSWVEEQSLKNAPPKTAGDQPHGWAATVFVRLAISMLACERADIVHLLLATPPEWLRAGAVNRLDRLHTTNGPLSLALNVSADGRRATFEVSPPPRGSFLLHTRSLAAAGFRFEGQPVAPDTISLTPGKPTTVHFTR
jgi:hypothetical protein